MKLRSRMRPLLLLLVAATLPCRPPCCHAAAAAIDVKTAVLTGYTGMTGCTSTGGKEGSAFAVYPADASANTTYPYLAFAHGMNCDPAATYTAMLKSVAAQGFIIIAPNSDNSGWCVHQYKDQLRGIDIAYGFSRRGLMPFAAIDWAKGVGLLGHSMGAHATVQSAGMSPASPVALKAAMAFAPQYFGQPSQSFANKVAVPIFYVSASGDRIVDPSKVQQQYDDTPPGLSKVFAEIEGYNHMSVSTSDSFSYFTAAFFNCHMLGRTTGSYSCDSVYDYRNSTAWCPLCRAGNKCPHAWPMHVCERSYKGAALHP